MACDFNGLTQRIVDAAGWALSGVASTAAQIYADAKGKAVEAFKAVSSEPTLWNHVYGVFGSIDKRADSYEIVLSSDGSNPDLRRMERSLIYRFANGGGDGAAGLVAINSSCFSLSADMRYREFNVIAGDDGVVLQVGYAGDDGVLRTHDIKTPLLARAHCTIKEAPADVSRPRVS